MLIYNWNTYIFYMEIIYFYLQQILNYYSKKGKFIINCSPNNDIAHKLVEKHTVKYSHILYYLHTNLADQNYMVKYVIRLHPQATQECKLTYKYWHMAEYSCLGSSVLGCHVLVCHLAWITTERSEWIFSRRIPDTGQGLQLDPVFCAFYELW